MRGVRPLKRNEVVTVAKSFTGKYAKRNRALFLFQAYTGWRISQCLALLISDVLTVNGSVQEHVWIDRRHVKKKGEGQVSFMPEVCRDVMREWLQELREQGYMRHDHYLWQSRNGANEPMSRSAVYRAYRKVFRACGLQGRLGTHSLRKFCTIQAFKYFKGDLMKVLKITKHKDLASLAHYLEGCDDSEARQFAIDLGDLRYGAAG